MAVLSRRDQTAETRRANEVALLEAVVELVNEGRAFADVGIQQIVERAGLSRPTFYAYFRDKREVVLQLGERLEEDLVEATDPWFAAEDVTARDTLRSVLDVFGAHRATVAAVIEAATYDVDVAAFWRRLHDRFLPGAMDRIRAGRPNLDDEALRARAYALVWMTERTLTEHLVAPSVDEDALLDQLAWMWETAARDR